MVALRCEKMLLAHLVQLKLNVLALVRKLAHSQVVVFGLRVAVFLCVLHICGGPGCAYLKLGVLQLCLLDVLPARVTQHVLFLKSPLLTLPLYPVVGHPQFFYGTGGLFNGLHHSHKEAL